MVKRFTDTDKWKKKWFRKLSAKEKTFWFYLLDSCSYAGIWEVDFELAEFFCGRLEEGSIRKLFSRHYNEICNGKYWHVTDFISFQYGSLSPACKPHQPVIKTLKKFGLWKEYQKGTDTLKGKEEKKDKEQEVLNEATVKKTFENIWRRYPKKVGKKQAFANFSRLDNIMLQEDRINEALDNYLSFLKQENLSSNWRKPQDAKNWFLNWSDWADSSHLAKSRKPLKCTFCKKNFFVEDISVKHKEVSPGEVVIQYVCRNCDSEEAKG